MPRGHRRGALIALLLLLPAISVSLTRAQAPAAQAAPVAPAAIDPTLVVSASVASLNKLAASAKELGVADIPLLTPGFFEQQMPFLGAGGLAPDRPLGVLLYGPVADLEKAATFVLPVNAGKAELKTFIDQGAQPVEGRTDLVALADVSFRRTKDQLVFGQMAGAVSGVREDVLTSGYVNNGMLARIDVDIAAIKRSMPDRYDAFFTEISQAAGEKADPVEQASSDMIVRLMRELTRLRLSVAPEAGGGLTLSVAIEPFTAKAEPVGKFPRAGFPEGTLFRADLAQPPDKALAGSFDTMWTLMEMEKSIAQLTPEQRAQTRQVLSDLTHLVLEGDAGSFGVEKVNDQFIVHVVTRRPDAQFDLEKAMRQRVDQVTALGKTFEKDKPTAAYSTYATAAGTKVHRLVLADEGKPPLLFMDAVRQDGAVLFSLATVDGKFVERLVSLKPDGETTAPLSGWVDLAALAASTDLPAEGGVDPKSLEELKTNLKGQRLGWTATPDNGALRIDVNIPKSLLQNLPKVVALFQ